MPDSPEGGAEVVAPPKPKKRKKLFVMLLAALLVSAGAASAWFFLYRVRPASAKAAAESAEPRAAHEGEPKGDAEEGEVSEVVELQPFIINLADENEPRYLRMTVSLGLSAEGGEGKADPLFTTKVRNALLNVMTTKRSQDVLTVEGKALLRKQLLIAAREAVSKPRVSAIYITDFIVQL